MRYRIWLVASLKFLFPLSLLIALGGHIGWAAPSERTVAAYFSTVQAIATPASASSASTAAAP